MLCRQFAGLSGPRRADLHIHTTASDGSYTPSQAVALARQAKLAAIAITDHDTLAGLAEARRTAAEMPTPTVDVIPGVEITTTFQGRELHLLGYFVRDDDVGLNTLLERTCALRRVRFRELLAKLAEPLPEEAIAAVERLSTSLGRRHIASLLVRCGRARTHHEAWQRFVGRLGREIARPDWPRIEDAIAVVRAAGGVPSLAHPPAEFEEAEFAALQGMGLLAVEAAYPWSRAATGNRIRDIAGRLGLRITGGSDCHGPEPSHRGIGSHGISLEELAKLHPG